MSKTATIVSALGVGLVVGIAAGGRLLNPAEAQAPAAAASYSAVPGLPWRNANTASPPGAGGSRQDPEKGMELWRGASAPFRELDVDARRHHAIIVVDGQGNITEDWTQWDHMFKRPHAVYISPYD